MSRAALPEGDQFAAAKFVNVSGKMQRLDRGACLGVAQQGLVIDDVQGPFPEEDTNAGGSARDADGSDAGQVPAVCGWSRDVSRAADLLVSSVEMARNALYRHFVMHALNWGGRATPGFTTDSTRHSDVRAADVAAYSKPTTSLCYTARDSGVETNVGGPPTLRRGGPTAAKYTPGAVAGTEQQQRIHRLQAVATEHGFSDAPTVRSHGHYRWLMIRMCR